MNKLFIIFIASYSINAFAYYTENIANRCESAYSKMYAVFTINQYNCPSGYFLPSDTFGCEACPSDFSCPGGIYEFNKNKYQGATKSSIYITHDMTHMCAENIIHRLTATFTPNVHNCNPGYYLPANVDACTICPSGNKCPGGQLTFNETTAQGIEPCNGSFAPIGSAVCYPHILHIGNEMVYLSATKRTTPSVNFRIGNDVFYANMTTTRTVMTAGSSHYFKTIYNNTVYYVCDDSVPECRGE